MTLMLVGRFVEEMANLTVEVGQDATFVCVVSEIHGYRWDVRLFLPAGSAG